MSKYYLLPKKVGILFSEYKGNAPRLSQKIPFSVDEVVVGKLDDENFRRVITIFRGSDGKVIEKSFDYSDKNFLKNRVYARENNFIGEDEFVTSVNMKEYKLPRNLLSVFWQEKVQKFGVGHILWERLVMIANHFSENFKTGETLLTQVKVQNDLSPNRDLHVFKEFPRIVDGRKDATKQKELSFLVDTVKNRVVHHTEKTSGVKMPVKDSYLAFRAMDVDDIKEPITKRFLKERGLQRLKLVINTDFEPSDDYENLIAIYKDYNGSINFNKFHNFTSKTACVGTARHETEHAWQYFLKALYTGGDNERTCLLAKANEHLLHSPQIFKEAEDYTEAIRNYVPYNKNYQLYKANLIERKALEAELAEREKYDREGGCLRGTFRHIPEKFL